MSEELDTMVQIQIANRGVTTPRVLDAMRSVPRHLFVPEKFQSDAYRDSPLPIGYEQTISQPYIVARMVDLLDVETTDRVLEIGTGSGYCAAVLSKLCDDVHSVERIQPLVTLAKENLRRAGIDSVHVSWSDGTLGLPEQAPFDGILVSAALTEIPDALLEQLAVGGRLIAPVGDHFSLQTLQRITRLDDDGFRRDTLESVAFVPCLKGVES